ncbi:MBL fold metallo-hydrolase [Actibacterium sp. 188UL27-1]|uniref:MBL fold metallo-hydrolase n=1 Tax=Actibacterium sp. 188UL27-1 TaxID=2786961 RepID=UPI001959DFF3|nr:MBL fold metallo-hydrolase [Actibacterium sp. 188UL27-1]MBM7066477.1 MBL fold metallo-hydrolase [Actibacterium sp. 188UL27-1]
MTLTVNRRQAFFTSVAAPAVLTLPTLAHADGHEAAPAQITNSITLGDMKVTSMLDGVRHGNEEPQGTFGMNVSAEEFATVSEENFIPVDTTSFYFTPTLVETGEEVILFDTGLGQGGLIKALAEAGKAPEDITTVVLTHMHPDHIGGMMTDGAPTYANANYITGQTEYDFWAAQEAGNRVGDLVKTNVTPLADKMTFIGDGGSVTSGITGMASFGHTPGHMVYMLESGGQQLVLTADLANHYVWSLAYPDWEVRFDMDKEAAAGARRDVLGMLAADKIPFIGYHMPFPALGYVAPRDDGFRYVPVSYQFAG